MSKLSEKQFQSQIIDIAKRCGWIHYHVPDSRRCEPGFPDFVIIKDKVLFRELKTEKGRLTPAQKMWGEKLTSAGANYAVWRPSNMKEIIKQLSYS